MNRRSKPGNTTTTIIYGAVLILCVAVASLNFLIPLLIEQKHNLDAGSSPYGLFIPEGTAVALPSIRISAEESASINRKFYGGAGDKAHLGGFTNFDPMGVR